MTVYFGVASDRPQLGFQLGMQPGERHGAAGLSTQDAGGLQKRVDQHAQQRAFVFRAPE
jgi:hypothetical protein